MSGPFRQLFWTAVTNCILSGITINGTISASNVVVVGDPNSTSWSVSATVSYSLTISDGIERETFSGSFGFTLAVNGTSEALTISITSFTVVDGGGSTDLANIAISYSENPTAGTYSFTISGAITDSNFGTVTVQTTTPFTGTIGAKPTAGSMTITGANGCRLVLTAMGGNNVRLEVFTDAADQVADIINTTWANLDAL